MKSLLLAVFLLFFLNQIPAQVVTTFAGGNYGYINGGPTVAAFGEIMGICVNHEGTIYVVDVGNHRVRKITAQGEVSTFAGSGTVGHADGVGTDAQFDYIRGICVDATGTIYVTEYFRVRKITPEGVVTTLAGGEDQGYVDGAGSTAQFFALMGICVDANGSVYVADAGNNRIRKITAAGMVSTVVDGTSIFGSIYDLCIDNATGTLFVTDRYGQKIYKVTPTGSLSVFAGSDMGYQEGIGTDAQFNFPFGICIDSSGNLYVTDNAYLIRKITSMGVVSTLAGGPGGDLDGIGTAARFGNLEGICVTSQGIVYVVDTQYRKIRKITPSELGIAGNSQLKPVTLYPNPARGMLSLAIDSYPAAESVTVTDLSGMTLYSGLIRDNVTAVDISKLARGVYFATVTAGNKTTTQKFIVE